jgi:rare lipoprotein A
MFVALAACGGTSASVASTPRRASSRSAGARTAAVSATPSGSAETTTTSEDSGNDLDEQYADAAVIESQEGVASYYHDSLAGNRTANGEVYKLDEFTCANRTLPFGSIVRVTRLDDRRRVVHVRVNDRGPFGRRTRIVDLSRAAADQIGLLRDGIARVRADVVRLGDGPRGDDAHRARRRRRRR